MLEVVAQPPVPHEAGFRNVVCPLKRKAMSGGSVELDRVREEVEQLRALVESNEDVRHRIGEIEERMDFAERVLARPRDQIEAGPS